MVSQDQMLLQILSAVESLQSDNKALTSSVASLTDRVNKLSDGRSLNGVIPSTSDGTASPPQPIFKTSFGTGTSGTGTPTTSIIGAGLGEPSSPPRERRTSTTYSSRIILTTYPGQSGIDPIPMNWGDPNPMKRGPVVVSRAANTVRKRNGVFRLIVHIILICV